MGPFLVGLITQITGDVKNGVLSLIVLFVMGLIFLVVESRMTISE